MAKNEEIDLMLTQMSALLEMLQAAKAEDMVQLDRFHERATRLEERRQRLLRGKGAGSNSPTSSESSSSHRGEARCVGGGVRDALRRGPEEVHRQQHRSSCLEEEDSREISGVTEATGSHLVSRMEQQAHLEENSGNLGGLKDEQNPLKIQSRVVQQLDIDVKNKYRNDTKANPLCELDESSEISDITIPSFSIMSIGVPEVAPRDRVGDKPASEAAMMKHRSLAAKPKKKQQKPFQRQQRRQMKFMTGGFFNLRRFFSSSAHRPGNAGGGKASPPSQSVPQKESEAYKQPIREDEVAKQTYPASIEELLSTMSQDINHIFLALSKSEGQPVTGRVADADEDACHAYQELLQQWRQRQAGHQVEDNDGPGDAQTSLLTRANLGSLACTLPCDNDPLLVDSNGFILTGTCEAKPFVADAFSVMSGATKLQVTTISSGGEASKEAPSV